MLENIWNAITRLPMDQLERNLGGRIPSCSRHVRHDAVAMATALNILQLWASGVGDCGYTCTRGFTRTRPVPAGRVRVG